MLRLTGSALILGAVLWLQRSFHLRTLLRQRTLRALSGAFLALESAVRLTLTPLPALLRHLSCEPEAARFFEGVTANLARGEPLASAWEHAAKTLPIAARERETVSALGHALGGDEESVCAALTLAASELSRLEEELRQRERETGRITAALCLGGGAMLCILRQRTLRALSGAFLALESAVRLTLTPLPALLRHLSCEPEAARFFEGVTANLARGEPLASAWEHAAKTLPIAARERETVSALGHALGGDEESVCAALTLAASELSRLEEELRQRERETGRITAALCLGGGAMLCILLL